MPAVARAPAAAAHPHNHRPGSKSGAVANGHGLGGAAEAPRPGTIKGDRCSNPFRIPRHATSTGLRNVPQIIRERLTHVSFGLKICVNCRKRVYAMLKERKHLKPPSTRLSRGSVTGTSNGATSERRRSEVPQAQRKLEPVAPTPTPAPAPGNNVAVAKVPTDVKLQQPTVTMTVTATSMAEARAIKSLFSSARLDARVTPTSTPSLALAVGLQQQRQIEAGTAIGHVSNLAVESNRLLDSTMSRRGRPQSQQQMQQQQQQQAMIPADPVHPVKKICCFCGLMDDNEVEFGKFYQHSGIVTHYYCLLLSSNMEQKGNDDEGILGFLADDITKEIRRGKRLVCSYCKKNGATLGCCNAKCKRIFHFPCGLKAGSLHQFFGEFRSYCINHRPKQKIDERVKKEIENMTNILCYICYEDVEPLDSDNTLWAPCCKKNAWFHRKCVQQLAMSAGYFFKCPLCNNKREFQTAMLEYGIYIPRQDASWELVPNAFEELLYRHDRCDAAACLCPKGRTYTSNNAKWELALCRMCGSQGTHIFCGRLKWVNPIWECQECITILKKPAEGSVTTDDSTSNSNEIPIQREDSTLNVTIREYEEDSDSDISVGNESVPLESSLTNIPTILPQIKLRPGPRSFKLQQVQKLQNAEANKETTNQTNNSPNNFNVQISSTVSTTIINSRVATQTKVSNEVICIDSDEEAVEIVCESLMRTSMRNRRTPQSFGYTNGLASSSNSNSNSNSSDMPSSLLVQQSNVTIKASPGKLGAEHHFAVVESTPEPPSLLPAPEDHHPPIVEDSPFNIIISNVTSVPAEFFASVPDSPERDSPPEFLLEPPLHMDTAAPALSLPLPSTTNHLKRNHPCDEENECLIVEEAPKRARLETPTTTALTNSHHHDDNPNVDHHHHHHHYQQRLETSPMQVIAAETNGNLRITRIGPQLDTALLSTIKQSPSKAEASTTTTTLTTTNTALVGSGVSSSSSSHESCHGDAGTSPTSTTTTTAVAVAGSKMADTAGLLRARRGHDRADGDAADGGSAISGNGIARSGAADEQRRQLPVVDELPHGAATAATYTDAAGNVATDPESTVRAVLENGSSSHCSSSGGSGGSSKSRYSYRDRSGLIPDCVRLCDLKFKISGSDLELSYGACMIQVKVSSVRGASNDATNCCSSSNSRATTGSALSASSVSAFAGSNNPTSSEKSSSKSYQPQQRSDDSDESYRIVRSLRARTLRSFVYEDDNTLLEYPTSATESPPPQQPPPNGRILRKSLVASVGTPTDKRLDRNELKENWDPEVSSSSNNTFDHSNNNNNNNNSHHQANSVDVKDNSGNARDKSSKSEDNGFSQKEEAGNVQQRLLRRSNRIVRHFRSVQQQQQQPSNALLNGDSKDSDSKPSDNNNSFSPSFGKSNDQNHQSPRAGSRSLKAHNNGSSDLLAGEQQPTHQQDKHLQNVDMNDLSFALAGNGGKIIVNGVLHEPAAELDADFKVSIDLQKISNLMSAKPDLFFKSASGKDGAARRLQQRFYRPDDKLKVEFEPGAAKFLTKSQSFDCLLDAVKEEMLMGGGRCRSLESLSSLDSGSSSGGDSAAATLADDKKDCMTERKIRRSQRRRTRQFEKHECVR